MSSQKPQTPSPKKPEEYSGPTKYKLVLQLKKYNAAHEGAGKLPIPPLSQQSQLKVETLEILEKKRKHAQDAKKEAMRLIQDLLVVERCVNEDEALELDWDGISKKCKSFMALLENKEPEKRGKSREGGGDEGMGEEGKGDESGLVTMGVETELTKPLDATLKGLEEGDESDTNRGLNSIKVEKKSKLDVKLAQASNQAFHVQNHKEILASSDIVSILHAHSPIEDSAERTKRWQEQVHEAVGIPGASKVQFYDKPNFQTNDKHCDKHTAKEYMGHRATDQLEKERKDAVKREHFLKELDAEKQYQKKQQERKEKQKKERQQAESKMWKEEREKARLRREAAKKEQERLEKQEMTKPHLSRSRSGSDDYFESTRIYRPANHIPSRISRSSDPGDSHNVSESKHGPSKPKPQPASPEVHFTPSTKTEDHGEPSKNYTIFSKWLSSTPKRSPIFDKHTEDEKENELKQRREIAERLHSEFRKHT